MASPTRTLLHLTDLHFGSPASKGHYWNSEATELALPEHDRRGLLGSLLRDLRKQKLSPDLVIVSGDLLDKGAAEGVPMAIAFLEALVDKLCLSRERVVLVPGNHDVLRSGDTAARYASFDAICKGFYGALRPAFLPTTPAYERVERFDYASDLGMEVVAFNSCEALDATAGEEHGSVGTAQRDRAEELLDATEGRGLFRIAVMHHHLVSPDGVVRNDYSVMDDAGLVRRWLVERRFHLVLHGHQHLDWSSKEERDGWTVAITAGASAGVGLYGRKDWTLQIGYQLIVVEDGSVGRRIRREYDPQGREWIAAGKGPSEERLRFGAATAEWELEEQIAAAGARPGEPAPHVIPQEQLDLLLTTVAKADWPVEILLNVYQASAPPGDYSGFNHPTSGAPIRAMIYKLANAPLQHDGACPLLEFVWHLMNASAEPSASAGLAALTGDLRAWCLDIAAHIGVDSSALQQRTQAALAERKARQSYLVVKVDEAEHAEDGYTLRAWHVTAKPGRAAWPPDEVRRLELDENRCYSLDEIPEQLSKLIKATRSDYRLVIEMVVPISLLSGDVDQWLHKPSLGGRFPIGAKYRVVVRSLERSYREGCEDIVADWKTRWEELKSCPSSTTWTCTADYDDPGILHSVLCEKHGCQVALAFVPTAENPGLLGDLIGAGTPIAVWPRKIPAGGGIHPSIAELSAKQPVPDWRDEVLHYRATAFRERDPEHPGKHLTLLWDDPDRPPPEALSQGRFEAPEKVRIQGNE